MKVLTILGTRPEIIRLSIIIKKLDHFADKHVLVHTGQNYNEKLSDVFFNEMGIRKPDYVLLNQHFSLGKQLSVIFNGLENILQHEKPDKVLILGDTNSGLSSILAERMGIPVYHMEAGNRCFDLEVPEEKNRKVIDAISSINLPYTSQSKQNLLNEGIPSNRIILSGNPIHEVLEYYRRQIEESPILSKIKLEPNDYFLVTIHRAENVDYQDRLMEILKGLNLIADAFNKRLICSIHPRTALRIQQMPQIPMHQLVEFYEPFGFFDFVKLEKNAQCVLTDSGTVQEECCLLHVPTVTIRKTTERPETVECGSNMVSGIEDKSIFRCVQAMIQMPTNWEFPEGYANTDVSDKILKVLLGGIGNV